MPDKITNKSKLKSVLGLINFFRDYIKNCSQLALPLTAMLKKNKPDNLVWNEESIQALEQLKNALLSDVCLFAPNLSAPWQLYTDASHGAVGAWIGQPGPNGQVRPIAFISKKLAGSQLNWSIVEKELYSVVWSAQLFSHYLYNNDVELFSDHRPLQWLYSLTNHSPRLARWSILLQNYNIKPAYIKGSLNGPADFLSRF